VKGCRAEVVVDVDVRAGLCEYPDDIRMIFQGGKVDGGVPAAVARVDICAGFYERSNLLDPSLFRDFAE
jgi:hypothetical protein